MVRRVTPTRSRLTAVLLGAGLLLGGCGGSDAPPERRAAAPVAPSVTSAAPTPTTSPSATPTPAPVDSVTRVSESTLFVSPTGNISCLLSADSARCDIAEATFDPPAEPAGCEADYGRSLEVDLATAQFVCVSDTVADLGAAELAYGQTLDNGNLRCVSQETGISCAHRASGHSFRVSRGGYSLA